MSRMSKILRIAGWFCLAIGLFERVGAAVARCSRRVQC
jgi:hypothetical protein